MIRRLICALRGHPLQAFADCCSAEAGAGFAVFACPCGEREGER